MRLSSVDGAPAVLCGRGDGSAEAAGETAGGLPGPRVGVFPATQVPDPKPAVCPANGQFSHRPRSHPGLPGPVSGAVLIQRHPGCPKPLFCQ